MHTGVIRFFLPKKGFGYVIKDDSLEEYFLPGKNLQDLHLKKGDKISFELERKNNQIIATKVQLINIKNKNQSK